MIHPPSGWYFIFGHSPHTTSYAQVRSNVPASGAFFLLATRKRVSRIEEAQLITFPILLQLIGNILLDRSCILSDRIYIIPSAPKLSVSVCKFHIPVLLKYHQAAFSFQIPHESRNRVFWWYAQKQMDVIRTDLSFDDLDPLPLHSVLMISRMSSRFSSKKTFLRYLGANTIWYLQFHFVCAKLFVSVFCSGIYCPPNVYFGVTGRSRFYYTH